MFPMFPFAKLGFDTSKMIDSDNLLSSETQDDSLRTLGLEIFPFN